MKAKDEVAAGSFLELVNDLIVPGMVGNKLTFPMAERMRAGCTHPEPQATGNIGDGSAQYTNVFVCLSYVYADVGADFYNSLVHFCLHFIFDYLLAFLYDSLLMALEFLCMRIQYHVFLFYTQCKMFIADWHFSYLKFIPDVYLNVESQ
jgi:hypothetical protein